MFKEIFRFELFSALKKPMVYVFMLVNFLLVFTASVSDSVNIGGSNDAININSPHVIMTTTLIMTLIGIFTTTAFMNMSMLKDYQHKFDGLLFSTSISKIGYLSGRFLAAYVLSLLPFIGVLAGIGIAGSVGMVDSNSTGAFDLMSYVSTFLTGVAPNVFLLSAIAFLFSTLFRSSMYSFVGALAVIVLYILMGAITGNLDNEMIAVLSDPLGVSSYEIITKYSTIEDKNSQMMAFSGMWMINRLIWIGVACVLMLITYLKFSFTRKKTKNSKSADHSPAANPFAIFHKQVALPEVRITDSSKQQWGLFIHQLWLETKGVLKSTPFIIITLFGVINMTGMLFMVDERFGTGNHPVTYLMIDAIRGSLYVFLIAVVMYYAGALIWKDRDARMNELIDSTSFAVWIPYLSKLMALVAVVVLTLGLGIVCGIGVQTLEGYTNYEFGVYIQELMIYDLLQFVALVALAMFVQTIVNNKYIGYFAFLLVIVAFKFGPQALEISSNLVSYGSLPDYVYSDMNGWSAHSAGLAWFSTYWTFFAGLLTIAGVLFWVKGLEPKWSLRMRNARYRFKGNIAIVTLALGMVWIGTTGFLVYQTEVAHITDDERAILDEKYRYEIGYKQYAHIAQPRITALEYDIEIYPEERSYISTAVVTIRNKTSEFINDIHFTQQVNRPVDIQIPNSEIKLQDSDFGYYIYTLDQALAPEEERTIHIISRYTATGIENEVSRIDIIDNGTFLTNYKFMPTIGYHPKKEINDDDDRLEYGLEPKLSMAKLHLGCSAACQNTYISKDADWVNLKTTISTTGDQIAIAPGSLVNSWVADGRNYYEYVLEKESLNIFSFISGRYQVKRDVWTSKDDKEVDVEVYYHKGHEYNVEKMTEALKSSLTYFSNNFSPYPHQQARIIEFPRYADFAQAFPGTMPYSESLGFIANIKEKNAIDMVTYIVAHEMAHQWWGHQIVGANVQGATMLSESFAQYSALMIMKEMYGDDKMKQFMRYEMDSYLKGRSRENKEEMPLLYTEVKPYIHYNKGSIVMYALQDYIGEQKVNRALQSFAEAKAYQEAPYTNSLEFMDYLKMETPDSLQYLLHDMIETITLYSNKTVNASYRTLDNGQYEVTLDVEVMKFEADGQGKETRVAHDDYIDIGVFSKEIPEGEKYGRPIVIERVKINQANQRFTIVVDEEPHTAGVDPNYLLVDRLAEDNVKVLTKEE